MPAVIRIIPQDCPAPVEGRKTAARQSYADPTGALMAGVWRSAPDRLEVAYQRDEFCLILEGEVRLTGEDGATEVFRAGDAFLVPAGFRGVWEMPVAVSKYYVLHDPAK